MLQFLVLGQVPGTSIYVSFQVVAIAIVLLAIATTAYKLLSPWRGIKKDMRKIHDIAL